MIVLEDCLTLAELRAQQSPDPPSICRRCTIIVHDGRALGRVRCRVSLQQMEDTTFDLLMEEFYKNI